MAHFKEKAERWRFTSGDLLVFVGIFSIGLGMVTYSLKAGVEHPLFLGFLGLGVCGGSLGGLFFGTWEGTHVGTFIGFCLAAIFTLVVTVVIAAIAMAYILNTPLQN